jgi:hypothetical protein
MPLRMRSTGEKGGAVVVCGAPGRGTARSKEGGTMDMRTTRSTYGPTTENDTIRSRACAREVVLLHEVGFDSCG